jgi:hypothetical protein
MSTRMEIELTSVREDGSWTWRAAGARQPKGVVDGSVLPEGVAVGDVVRAEAEVDLEGILITSTSAPKSRGREPERLELAGTSAPDKLVTTSLVEKRPRSRRPRESGAGVEGASGARGRPGERRPERPRPATARGERGERRRRPAAEERAASSGRAPRREAPARSRRLSPASVHRDAVMETLSPEQRPVAEQVLRGGLPAVRHAVDEQNKAARAEGRPEIPSGPLLAMAEELLPRLKAADWKDRAEAAAKAPEEISLRDLRSVVVGAEVAVRDDADRLLARGLRETLERRVAKVRQEWLDSITAALDEGRLVRALHVSSRPPDPTARIPADLALRLREEAGKAMSPDIPSERWVTLLEAVATSPVRRTVKPAGLPLEPSEALLEAARRASGRVPEVAHLLGVRMPPPPGPPRRPRRVPPPAPAARKAPAPAPPDTGPATTGGGESEPPSESNDDPAIESAS